MIDGPWTAIRVPTWAWPTVLAFDAPLVAVGWQLAFARVFAVDLPPSASLLLGLGVWLVYSADRMLDSLGLTPGSLPTLRHAFVLRRRRPLLLVWLAGLLLALGLASASLDRATLGLGGLLALGSVLYLVSVQLRSRRVSRRGAGRVSRRGEHLQVGVLFAAGVALFAWPQLALSWLLPLALFGALCTLNCGYVEHWERSLDDGRGRIDNDGPGGGGLRRASLLLALAGLGAFGATELSLCLAVALGAIALHEIDRRIGGLPPILLRTLADTALVLPLLVVPLLP